MNKFIFKKIILALLCICFTINSSESCVASANQNTEEIISRNLDSNIKIVKESIKNKEIQILSFARKYDVSKPLNSNEYNYVKSFASFVIKNDIPIEHVEYLNSIITKDSRLEEIINVYNFWLTTSEDITLISDILAVADDFWGDNWIENAFNYITNDKCGVIKTKEELFSYYEKGLTKNDILEANILCRKGKKTIHEILQMRLEGYSWDVITTEINSYDLSRLSMNQNKQMTRFDDEFMRMATPENADEKTKARIKSKVRLADIRFNKHVNDEIESCLYNNNITSEETDYMQVAYQEYEYEKKARENGMSEKFMNQMKQRGFTPSAIYDVSLLAKEKNCSLMYALQEYVEREHSDENN